MPWNDYWRDHVDAAEATEKQVDAAWKKALAVAFLWERWFRRKTVLAAMDLPIVKGGWIDTSDRRVITRFRVEVRRNAEFANRQVRRALGVGLSRDEIMRIRERRSLPSGFVRDQLDRVAARVPPAVPRARDLAAGAAAASPTHGGGASGLVVPGTNKRVVLPSKIGPALLQEIEREIKALPITGGVLEDRWEVGSDAIINISRNLGYELRRVTETTVRLTGRHSKREAMIAYLDGDARKPGAAPWQMNRNNLRLSATAHIRGMHRRRAIENGVKEGVTHFRLDVPRSRLGDVSPGGLLGQHVWQARPLSQWQEIHDKVNRARRSASSFDTLGLHHGDFSYVVPVPAIYLPAARRQGRVLRAAMRAGTLVAIAGGE